MHDKYKFRNIIKNKQFELKIQTKYRNSMVTRKKNITLGIINEQVLGSNKGRNV